MIKLKDITVQYGDLVALKSVSLSVEKGEKVAIIGPSGAGKSTLMREIYNSLDNSVTLIHQQLALVPQLKVFHNVYMGRLNQYPLISNLRNLVLPNPDRFHEVSSILHSLGIEAKIDTPVSILSGGEQQRVAIARAIYNGGEIMLGDEPISSVDPRNSELIMEKLTGLDKTLVFSLHNVEIALQYATRVVGMKCGNIHFDLPPNEVDSDKLSDLYSPC